MAFIPIHAKADIPNSKKGKITPAQASQLNAWCLASKTGILDCLGKCETETLIYNATDQIAEIVFNSGYIVICGRLVECEQGTKVTVETPVSGEIEGKIIARYSLGFAQEGEFVVTTKTGPLIQENLNSDEKKLSGVYEFELYSYTATPTSVTLKRENVEYIPDLGGKLNDFITFLTGTGLEGEGSPPLQDYDKGKGTIEERLTALGFKEATITDVNNTYINKIDAFTQGKVVAVRIKITGQIMTDNINEIPKEIQVAKISNIDLSSIGSYSVCYLRDKSGSGDYARVNNYSLDSSGVLTLRYYTSKTDEGSKLVGGFVRSENPTKNIVLFF